MDFDLQNTGQSDIFHENLKWSHGHYGHFAPAGLIGNPFKSSVFSKSVGVHFSTKVQLLTNCTESLALSEIPCPPPLPVNGKTHRVFPFFGPDPPLNGNTKQPFWWLFVPPPPSVKKSFRIWKKNGLLSSTLSCRNDRCAAYRRLLEQSWLGYSQTQEHLSQKTYIPIRRSDE